MSSQTPPSFIQIVMMFVVVGGLFYFLFWRTPDSSRPSSESAYSSSATTSSDTQRRRLRTPGADNTIIFKSKQAISDAMAIMGSGGSPAAWFSYVACVVPNETAVTRLNVSFGGASEIVVNTGEHAGRRGWVPMEFTK